MQRIVCSDTRSMAVSMSYMRCFLVSPVAVRGVEIRGDVTLDRVRQRREARVIARAAKIFDRGMGEILAIVGDRPRRIDVVDVWRAPERRIQPGDQVAKALPLSAARIVNAGDFGRFNE